MRAVINLAAVVITTVAAMCALAYGSISNMALATSSYIPHISAPVTRALAAAPDISYGWGRPVHLVTAVAKIHKNVRSLPPLYRVRAGNTLSSISAALYGSADYWTEIYWANKSQIRYANIINIGQNFRIPLRYAHIPAPPTAMSPPAPAPVTASVQTVSSRPASQPSSSAPAASAPGGGYSVSSAFQACVIRAESGGNPQIWNPTGHWGLYQFSYSTWVAHGGAPGDFGHAGAGEQTQVFWNTVAQDGTADWAPYDGC
jgi:hypothetical protein